MDIEDDLQQMLQRLIGLQLDCVIFVRSYVQLKADDALITPVLNPKLIHADVTLAWAEPGYRDMLCDQIDHYIASAELIKGSHFQIQFDTGVVVRVSLEEKDYVFGPEALTIAFGPELWVF